jgi:hypothetical protein
MDDWAKKRLSELEAAAPVKRRNRKDAFVLLPLGWLEATRATRTPQALVSVWFSSRLEGKKPDLPGAQRPAGTARSQPLRKVQGAGET